MTQYADEPFVPRSTCYRCFRPEALCYCADLPSIQNKTRIVIVQHPRERFHPLNTARIAELGLASSVVLRVRLRDIERALFELDLNPNAALLFPSPEAHNLEQLEPNEQPSDVVLLDGTWSQAKNLLRDVPALARYRRVKFTPSAPSAYRIRREPHVHYLSTIESVAHVLGQLEPETRGISQLKRVFSGMIDRNLAARKPSEEGTRHRSKKRRIHHRFPEALSSSEDRFVVAYCEGTSRFARSCEGNDARAKEPLVVYLKRLNRPDILRILLRTAAIPPARLLAHLALREGDIEAEGVSRDQAARIISSELGSDDVLAVWNSSSHRILSELGVAMSPSFPSLKRPAPDYQRACIALKGAFCDYLTYRKKRGEGALTDNWGGMGDMLRALEIPWSPPVVPGRGLRRLGQTAALLGWIIEAARES